MFLCTVPMFHIYGLVAFATGLLTSGSTIVVLSKFEMHDMLLSIQRNRVSYLPLVALINVADQGPAEQGSDRGFLEKYPMVTILQGYGLTKSTGVGASTDSLEESRKYGTTGLFSTSMEAMIVDPDSGHPLAMNKMGELWLTTIMNAGTRRSWVGLGAQLTMLGMANDIGENFDLIPGFLSKKHPPWLMILISVLACFFGYGLIWLIVNSTILPLPYWMSRREPTSEFLIPHSAASFPMDVSFLFQYLF
ncbi:hypothetical protein ACFX1S_024987 [Malus domestica]